jgi:outer membrane protein
MKTKLMTRFLLLAVLFSANSFGQTKRHLSLPEAITLGILNNSALRLSKLQADEATANHKEMLVNRYPDFKVTGSYLRVNNPDLKVSLRTNNNASGGSEQGGNTPKVGQVVYGLANVTMPVFSGFRLRYAIESSKYLEQAAHLDAASNQDAVIQNIIAAYANLYKSSKLTTLMLQNLDQQKQRVKDFRNMEKNGLLARNDLLKAQLQESSIELALLDAQSDYRMASVNMALMLGLADRAEIVPDSVEFDERVAISTVAEYETTALASRREMAAQGCREKAAERNIKSVKGEYYPSLAVTGGYIAADIQNVLTVTNAMNIGVGLQYNLASLWKTGAKLEVAKVRLREAQTAEQIMNEAIRQEVTHSYEQFLLAFKKIEVYQKATEQADENYRITKNKQDNGLATATELLEADFAQLQANMNYAFARVDAMVAYKKLEQVTGSMQLQLENN